MKYKSAKDIKNALLQGEEVIINKWSALINDQDEVEIWDPKGEGVVASLAHLDKAVQDFHRLAQGIPETMPKPVTYPATPSGSGPLGDDTSGDKPWTDPKVNKTPVMQGPTSDPDLMDDTSQDEPWTDPEVNTRPQPEIGRGGLPDTELGKDTQKNPVEWEDKLTGPDTFRMAQDMAPGDSGKEEMGTSDPDDEFYPEIEYEPHEIENQGETPSPLPKDLGGGVNARRRRAQEAEGLASMLNGVVLLKESVGGNYEDFGGTVEMGEDVVHVAIVHDGSGYTPGAALHFSHSSPDEAIQQAYEALETIIRDQMTPEDMAELEKDAEGYGMYPEELMTETFDGRVFSMTSEEFKQVVEGTKDINKRELDVIEFGSDFDDEDEDFDVEASSRFTDTFDTESSSGPSYQDLVNASPSRDILEGIADPEKWAANQTIKSFASGMGRGLFKNYDKCRDTANKGMDNLRGKPPGCDEASKEAETPTRGPGLKKDLGLGSGCRDEAGCDKESVAPPGMEDVVKELKKDPDVEEPYAVAWSIYNKKQDKKSQIDLDFGSFPGDEDPDEYDKEVVLYFLQENPDLLEEALRYGQETGWGTLDAVRYIMRELGLDEGNGALFQDLMDVMPKREGPREKPSWDRESKVRRQAGPRLRENWGGDGAYSRDLEAESAEELYHLTRSFGQEDDYDWSSMRPAPAEAMDGAIPVAGSKEAVDESAKSYWKDYFKDYGEKLVEDDSTKKDRGAYEPKVDETPEPAGQQKVKSRRRVRRGQAAPAPQEAPESAPPGGMPAVPDSAPQTPPAAPGSQPPAGKPQKAPGAGDEGLKALGWTPEDIKAMDEESKQKILQVQLKKPGSGAPAAGAPTGQPGQQPAAPKPPAKPAPQAPQSGPAPMPATPDQGMPKPVAKRLDRESKEREQINRAFKMLTAQVPVEEMPAPPAPQTAPSEPVQMGPQTAPAEKVDEFQGEVAQELSPEAAAMNIYNEILRKEVKASSPEQVPAIKAQELVQRLLTEVGMPVAEARQLFGLSSGDGFNKLFQ